MQPIAIPDQDLQQYRDQGYLVLPGLISREVVDRVFTEITAVIERRPAVPDELIQYEPDTRGRPWTENSELDVRKLFRLVKHLDFFRELASGPALLSIARTLLGPKLMLAQSMLLMKPPHTGGPKVWHQDNGYFELDPPACFGFWIACDPTDVDNGCMHIVPGSHLKGLQPHAGAGDDYGLAVLPRPEVIRPVPLQPGDALVFHCELFHHTPANRTARRRRAIQYHYMSAGAEKKKNPFPWEPEAYFE